MKYVIKIKKFEIKYKSNDLELLKLIKMWVCPSGLRGRSAKPIKSNLDSLVRIQSSTQKWRYRIKGLVYQSLKLEIWVRFPLAPQIASLVFNGLAYDIANIRERVQFSHDALSLPLKHLLDDVRSCKPGNVARFHIEAHISCT